MFSPRRSLRSNSSCVAGNRSLLAAGHALFNQGDVGDSFFAIVGQAERAQRSTRCSTDSAPADSRRSARITKLHRTVE